MKILKDECKSPLPDFLDLFMSLIENGELMSVAGGQFLTIFEGVDDPQYAHHYTDLYQVRRELYRAVAEHYQDRIFDIYNRYSEVTSGISSERASISAIKRRQVKNTALMILAALDIPSVHQVA